MLEATLATATNRITPSAPLPPFPRSHSKPLFFLFSSLIPQHALPLYTCACNPARGRRLRLPSVSHAHFSTAKVFAATLPIVWSEWACGLTENDGILAHDKKTIARTLDRKWELRAWGETVCGDTMSIHFGMSRAACNTESIQNRYHDQDRLTNCTHNDAKFTKDLVDRSLAR